MSVLHNVRAFLGLSPQEGEDDAYHFGVKDDDTGAMYFDDEEVDDDDVDVDVDLTIDDDTGDDDDEEEISDDTLEGSTYDYNYEAEEDASVEITFEDGTNEIRIVETERPKERSKRSNREPRNGGSSDTRRRGSSKRLRAKPDPAMALQEARPKIVKPRSFADAQTVADGFKADIPIVMNLMSVDQELARRLIDFASGFCYVSGGEMERIRSRVFLLTPESAVLSSEDRRLLASRRYDR